MVDNEIVKALECCSSGSYGCENGCPLDKECNSPIIGGEKIMRNALDLINRQKEENERLKHLLEREEKATLSLSKQCYKDGVKEFAERLDKEFSGVAMCNYGWVHNKIRKVLKEKVGEDK